jgi:hypothetical protein
MKFPKVDRLPGRVSKERVSDTERRSVPAVRAARARTAGELATADHRQRRDGTAVGCRDRTAAGTAINAIPGGAFAVWRMRDRELLGVSEEAWRWLGWPTIIDDRPSRLPGRNGTCQAF